MGFLGSWRGIIRSAKNKTTGILDINTVSNKMLEEAKHLQLHSITPLLSTKYLKNINNKAFLGKIELDTFVKASRLGDYTNSFEKAFAGTPLLANPNVEHTLQKLLNEAATTLPDIHIVRNANAVSNGRRIFEVTDKIDTADELSRAVAKNNQLKRTVDKLVSSVRRTKKLKFLGYTVLFTVLSITAYDIYKKCAEISANGSGCFLYYLSGNEIRKCKISSYSCLHSHKGDLCSNLLLTPQMAACVDCQTDSNKEKPCIHCSHEDELNKNLDEKQILRCESPDPMDVLLEGVHQTIDGIASAGSHVVSSLFGWINVGLLVSIFIIVIVIIIIVITR